MRTLAVVGGTGIDQLSGFIASGTRRVETPYGEVSSPLQSGEINGVPVVFLQRHGQPRSLPPHAINYRANLWALRDRGVTDIVALNAVGSIAPALAPGSLVVPHQLVDYTWGRAHTFEEGGDATPAHVDFTEPYTDWLRQALLRAAEKAGEPAANGAVMAVTQGPRLETAAEVRRLRSDGCDIVGMTGMPEAALARELDLRYASLAMVVNVAAGLGEAAITMESIICHLQRASSSAARVLAALVSDNGLRDV